MIRNFLNSKPSVGKCEIERVDDVGGTILAHSPDMDKEDLVIWVMTGADAASIKYITEYMSRAVRDIEREGYLSFARRTRELCSILDRGVDKTPVV